ncbi:hypothetical protein ACS0TY_014116 [Phlomoides rotata]
MSTIVCQNLVSCFESHLAETTTTLKLKVAPPPPPPATDDHRNLDFDNWGVLQNNPEKTGDVVVYVKKGSSSSFSKLSPKSLELCTENLGSETGTDIASDCSSIFSSSPPFSPSSSSSNSGDFTMPLKTVNCEGRQRYPYHTYRKIKNFPPPLTSSNSLQVRHHREGGRLIIEAVEAPFRNSYLQAERSDGRLKLCFLRTASAEEEVEEEECGEETAPEEGPTTIDDVELEKEEFDDVEIEKEKEKLKRLSRCKEGSKGMCSNWKTALWVATS